MKAILAAALVGALAFTTTALALDGRNREHEGRWKRIFRSRNDANNRSAEFIVL
jgi:hypothetical protein